MSIGPIEQVPGVSCRREPDLGTFTGARLRQELEMTLGLDAGGLKALSESC